MSANYFSRFTREQLKAMHSAMTEFGVALKPRPNLNLMSRKELEGMVAKLPAECLHVTSHGRKSGPRPGSLFWNKWQERQKLIADAQQQK